MFSGSVTLAGLLVLARSTLICLSFYKPAVCSCVFFALC